MRPLSLALLLTLTSLPCPWLCRQTRRGATPQVGHDVWTFKEGAPEDIISIAQTTDGFLGLASPTGLFRV
jgi:hypothetical protein